MMNGLLLRATARARGLRLRRSRAGALPLALLTTLAAGACSDSPTDPFEAAAAEVSARGTAVTDLAVDGSTESTVRLRWTQTEDAARAPASYEIRYAEDDVSDWDDARRGCFVAGEQAGAEASCIVQGLEPGERYAFRLLSYRGQAPVGFSNVVEVETSPPEPEPVPIVDPPHAIWIGAEEVRGLPTSGPGWERVLARAEAGCGRVNLADQEQNTNVCVMAKALAFARTGEERFLAGVLSALEDIAEAPAYKGRALALGREIGAYVIAADLIALPSLDPALDERFRAALEKLRVVKTEGAAANLVDCHERRPNNWGAHCGAARMAIAVYLGDDEDLERAARVFRGYLGDRSAYAGFDYGADLTWQCDPAKPVGINPVGCERDGLSLDGVLADDQRRGGRFRTNPPKENYVWEALQGLVAQAVILQRRGYDAFEWEDRALLRAARWLHDVNDFPAVGDDTWIPALLNHYYGTSFPVAPGDPGKNLGWTDWTHP